MKWLLFAMVCWFGVPLMTVAAAWRSMRAWLLGGLVASTAMKISVNFCSMALYRGADRGFEVCLSDLIMVSLAMGMICFNFRRVRWIPFNTPLLFAFFVSLAISTYTASAPLLAAFTLVKVVKGGLLYWTVYNAFHLDRSLEGLWWGCIVAAASLTVSVAWQKYGQGLYRPHGTFDHSNTIPAYAMLIIPFLLSWVLHKDHARSWKCVLAMAALSGLCFCIIATLSRAGAVVMAAALIGVMAYALFRRPINLRRGIVVGVLGLFMTVGAAKSFDTLVMRFLHAPEASHDARKEFNKAAAMMAGDHTFGVGLNCYSHMLTVTPKYRDHIEVMRNESQAGVCHHIYWLTAAETGWIGLCLYLLVVARFWLRLPRPALAGADYHRAMLLAFMVSIAAVHLIGLFEWVFRITPVFHLFIILTGFSIALAEKLDATAAPQRWRWGWRFRPTRKLASPAWGAAG